jgi:hypothetical protein
MKNMIKDKQKKVPENISWKDYCPMMPKRMTVVDVLKAQVDREAEAMYARKQEHFIPQLVEKPKIRIVKAGMFSFISQILP